MQRRVRFPIFTSPLLDADSLGVHLSVADAILLLVVALAGVAAALNARRPAG